MGIGLAWSNNQGFVVSNGVKAELLSKPSFSFSFDSLFCEPDTNNIFKVIANTSNDLSDIEVKEITTFITAFDFSKRLVMGVDKNGIYLGKVSLSSAYKEIPVAPPAAGNWVWDFVNSAWSFIQAVDANGRFIGNAAPGTYATLVSQAPSQPYFVWDFQTKQWKDGRTLDDFKTIKKEEINSYIEKLLVKGFDSSALGSLYHYDNQITDQVNLSDAVSLGTSVMFKCTDMAGKKALVQHTASQIQTVRADSIKFKMQLLQQADTLKQQAANALTIDDVNKIVLS